MRDETTVLLIKFGLAKFNFHMKLSIVGLVLTNVSLQQFHIGCKFLFATWQKIARLPWQGGNAVIWFQQDIELRVELAKNWQCRRAKHGGVASCGPYDNPGDTALWVSAD